MKKKAKKQKKKWMNALAVVAFILQAVEFGMELWDKRKASRQTRIPSAKRAV